MCRAWRVTVLAFLIHSSADLPEEDVKVHALQMFADMMDVLQGRDAWGKVMERYNQLKIGEGVKTEV